MQWREIEKLMKEDKEFLKILEEYDKTGINGIKKKTRTFTLSHNTIEKLRKIAKINKSNMSQTIEYLVDCSTR